jgi:CHAT domain-containing protein
MLPRRWTWGLALLLLAPGCGKREPDPAKGLAATSGHRLVEPRISRGVASAPCQIVSDGPGNAPRCVELAKLGLEQGLQLQKDGRAIEREAKRNPRPESLWDLGLLNLLWDWMDPSTQGVQRGSTGRIDLSIRLLEEAATAAVPGQARNLNDLAVAYYVRAQKGGDLEDYLRALDAAERAVAADGALPEARFNLALLLQALSLPVDAKAAWDRYQDIEPDPAWRKEAEARKERLLPGTDPGSWEARKPLLDAALEREDAREIVQVVGRFRQLSREYAEKDLLPGWAEAWLAGRSGDAGRLLHAARGIGAALAEVNGDRMVLDAVAVVDRLETRNGRTGLNALARAHLDYAEGFQLYKEERGERGAVKLASARDAFHLANSPWEGKAELYLAGCDYRQARYGEALDALARLHLAWGRRAYPSLLGEAGWMEAATRAIQGDLAGAVRSYRRSLSEFERLGEPERVATMNGLLAEILEKLGRRREAWQHLYRALRAAPQVRNPAYRVPIYLPVADAALKEGQPATALRFWNEVVRQAASSTDDLFLADALTWRGLLRSRLGDEGGVERDFEQARERLAQHEEDPARRRSEAMLDLVEGQLRTDRDPDASIRLLTGALERFAELGHQPLSLLAYQARARAYRVAGDRRKAEEDLASALQVYGRFGRGIQAEEERLAFLGATEGVFDELISLQALDLGAADRAFDSADRSRTRVLPVHLSQIDAGAEERQRLLEVEPQPLGLEEVRRRLPPGTVLIQYSALPDRLLIWVVRREGWSFREKAAPGADLRTQVKRLRSFGRPGWKEDSSKLYDLLLRPWIGEVGEGETLVVIPDKALHSIPFAALRNRDSGRFLVEEHRLAVSPSPTLYVRALGRERRLSRAPRVLAVGNPAFDRGLFPLSSLAGAEAEAKAIAGLYPGSADLLTGAQATSREFLSRVRQYEWIHFAGHSMVNLQNPLLSMLVLAPSAAGDTGAVTAREIYSMDLGETRMVVLSACETGAYDPEGEGASALARAFLAAGVPTVVASLWKVDDQPTSRLFQAFHRALRAGSDPVSALREAQIGLLRGAEEEFRDPGAWAAFEVTGASTH